MSVKTSYINISTKGHGDIIDISKSVEIEVQKSNLTSGIVCIFVSGSTAALTTVEYEPGLVKDIKSLFERIAPENIPYHHEETWHDGNGHSHARATLLGPSLTIPFDKATLLLGTWQQIILVDFDNRTRDRTIVVQIIGE
ncbi:MAG: secondary thiamine-phosphate synthase enzyme YjbQ [Candidatus Aureabacteria bacterium]|nr:secondary thiamine-phosphate synthase enzyme YjbQ [Candidatus Auribacterota bacterium]